MFATSIKDALDSNICLNRGLPLFFNLNVESPTIDPPLVRDGKIIFEGAVVVPIPTILVTIPIKLDIAEVWFAQQFWL